MRQRIDATKAFVKRITQPITEFIKKVLRAIGSFITKISRPVGKFYVRVVSPILSKMAYASNHNFVIRRHLNTLRLFSFINITVTRKRRESFYGYMFIMLWLIGYLIFTLYPMFYSLYLSFHTAYYNLETGIVTTWIGFNNYLNVFRSQVLLPLFGTYLGKMVLSVPLVVVFSIMIAVLINNPIKLKGVWRTIFFLPVVIATGPVIAELSNQDATSLPSLQDSPALAYITENLGPWIANPLESLLTSMLLVLWYAGIPILIFLAGLQKIDSSIYEAASIDGASPWDRFWKITLPSISPLISVAVIYIVVSMSLFVESGGILDLARTHMLVGAPDSAFWFGYGYAAAIAWIYFILMVILMSIFVGVLSIHRKEK
ncbi:MAG: sugar ABC transporter permease [Tenericutes bacterium HGW-Tenericutes-2]|jgi:ABC-type sugar transport system permease subunit|nr:MAG: sugar ABC transporter permease [Tenericutes bacterium HGW-Tenericutes-2]